MANKPKGKLERDMLISMREWTPERRQEFLLRADELHRTLRYIERRGDIASLSAQLTISNEGPQEPILTPQKESGLLA